MKKELELYVHIPFCVKKCAYCDFLSGPAGDGGEVSLHRGPSPGDQEEEERLTGITV